MRIEEMVSFMPMSNMELTSRMMMLRCPLKSTSRKTSMMTGTAPYSGGVGCAEGLKLMAVMASPKL